jgi:O-methyltransferase
MTPLEYAEQICYSSKETLHFTYEMAKKYKDTPGVYVECGVAAGAQIIAMAYGAPNKTIFAFDSFQGIPLPSNRDDQYPGIRRISEEERMSLPNPGEQVLESSGATVVSEGDFWHNIDTAFGPKKHLNIKTVVGWFENTVSGFDEPISILRLDGDLYNSTKVCLKYLFGRVIKGGCVIIDDWELDGCRAATYEYFGELHKMGLYELPFFKYVVSNNSRVAYFFK